MKRIEPNIDGYGNLARASFLADYVELLTIKGHRVRQSLLRDAIEDVFARKREVLQDPEGVDQPDWAVGEYAADAWSCLRQREEILGGRYPFMVKNNRLFLRGGVDIRSSVYVGVLCLSLAHVFKENEDLRVEYLFEELVGDSLEGLGLKVGRIGQISREQRLDFERTMIEAGRVLDFPTYPNVLTRRVAANDAGVDIVAHLDKGDKRRGRWLYIGQVTCAGTDSWRAKLHEPVTGEWVQYLGEFVEPVAFLAVPQHVEDRAISSLEKIGRAVLDRIQLVLHIDSIDSRVEHVIDEVLAAHIQTFAIQ